MTSNAFDDPWAEIEELPRYKELEDAIEAIEDEMRPLERRLAELNNQLNDFANAQIKRIEEARNAT